MNHFDPEKEVDGKRPIASHYYPLIGPYDSGDPAVLEYHLLLMKLAGIDGVIVDWYGLYDFNDYLILHKNTERLIKQINRLGMKFVICYEDQTVPALVKGGRITEQVRVPHVTGEIEWLHKKWFSMPSYVRLSGRPVLLSFGRDGLSDDEWKLALERLSSPVAYFSQHAKRCAAWGAFDWPVPNEGTKAIDRFTKKARAWPYSIPVAFPRFIDIYAQAKLHKGYGRIEDADGATLRTSLQRALKSDAPIIQIATWNDWGEGTVIEPNREFGYRDLEIIQELRRPQLGQASSLKAADLRLANRLRLRRKSANEQQHKQLDRIAQMIVTGDLKGVRAALGSGQ